jgi:hypothetical protein
MMPFLLKKGESFKLCVDGLLRSAGPSFASNKAAMWLFAELFVTFVIHRKQLPLIFN